MALFKITSRLAHQHAASRSHSGNLAMPFNIKVQTLNWLVIDQYFQSLGGRDEYESFTAFASDAKEVLRQLDVSLNRYGLVTLAAASNTGLWLETATSDLYWAFGEISKGKRLAPDQIDAIRSIGELARDAIELEDSAVSALVGISAFLALAEWSLRRVEQQARAALVTLAALRSALEAAKQKRTESIAGGIIDGMIVIATVLQPELILLSGIKAALGQKLLDDALGGSKSSATMNNLSTYSTNASIAQASLETFSFLTPAKSVPFIQVAGKPLAIVGLAFDADEIYAAFKNVDEIRRAIDRLLNLLRQLKRDLDTLRPEVLRQHRNAAAVRQQVKRDRNEAERLYLQVRAEAAAISYMIGTAPRWRYVK